MLIVRMFNAALCELWTYVDWAEANHAYSECLQSAQGADAVLGCYTQLVLDVAELSADFVSCLF
jgi:hypothetical protein